MIKFITYMVVLFCASLAVPGGEAGLYFIFVSLPVPTLFAYSLTIAPIVYALTTKVQTTAIRPILILVSVGLVGALAFVPHYLALSRANFALRNVYLKTVTLDLPEEITGVDLIGLRDGLRCERICRSLLLDNRAQWVRIKSEERFNSPTKTLVTYRLGQGKECFGEEVTDCVLTRNEPEANADISVEIQRLWGQKLKEYADGTQWLKSLHIFEIRNSNGDLIVFRFGGTANIPTIPALVLKDIHSNDAYDQSLIFWTSLTDLRKFTPDQYMVELGIIPAELSTPQQPEIEINDQGFQVIRDEGGGVRTRNVFPPSAERNQLLFSILEDDWQTTKPTNRGEVREWLGLIQNIDDWTPELIDLAAMIVKDRRIKKDLLWLFVGPMKQDAKLARTLIPIAFRGLSYPESEAIYYARFIGATARSGDPNDLLDPNADEYFRALENSSRDIGEAMLPVIGQFGVDPTPYLTARNGLGNHVIVKALCHTDHEWTPVVLPILEKYLADLTPDIDTRDSLHISIFRALIRHGASELVLTQMESLDKSNSRINHELQLMVDGIEEWGTENRFCR